MAIINPLDVTLSLIPEVTFGVIPACGEADSRGGFPN